MSNQSYDNRGRGPNSGFGIKKERNDAPSVTDEQLIKGYSISTFFDANGTIRPELISDAGPGNVKELSKRLAAGQREAGDSALNASQLRKFYDSFLRIENSKLEPPEKKVQLLMLKANAQYAGQRLKTRLFNLFLDDRIKLVLQADDDSFKKTLYAFRLHFQALVAYFPKN
ncbi:MAG: hypothetical protein FMNOHCHN_01502 [Ignavibacteriaceae bacterium]|nr:hypothetical protein [Ignavibacteriaceae bacterium]